MLPLALAVNMLAMLPAHGQEFTTFKGHGGPIMGLAMSPEGHLASASFDNSVGLWRDGTPTWREGHEAAVTAVDFDLAPVLLSGGDDFRVLMWHPERRLPLEVTRHLGKVADIASHPIAGIATAGWDGFVHLTALESPVIGARFETRVLKGHRSNVTAVGFAPDGTLYSASSDGTLRVWDNDDAPRTVVRHGFGINEIIVSADWIAYGAVDGGTRVIDHDGEHVVDLTLERRPILAMDYHPRHQPARCGRRARLYHDGRHADLAHHP